MANTKNEVATKQTFSVALNDKLNSMSNALPSDFNKARFVQNAIALLNSNPTLQKYPAPKLLAGLSRGALLGLDFFSLECYLVPYGNELNYQTSYIGSMKLAKKYSIRPIKEIYAELVREGDDFRMDIIEGERKVSFKPVPFSNKPIIGAFAVARFEDGGMQVELMSLEELENTRKHSKASNSMAWKDFTNEMYKKTVLRRLCKKIEIDFENTDQRITYDEEMAIETDPVEVMKTEVESSANSEDFIEAEVIEVEPVKEKPKAEKPKADKPTEDVLPPFLQAEDMT